MLAAGGFVLLAGCRVVTPSWQLPQGYSDTYRQAVHPNLSEMVAAPELLPGVSSLDLLAISPDDPLEMLLLPPMPIGASIGSPSPVPERLPATKANLLVPVDLPPVPE